VRIIKKECKLKGGIREQVEIDYVGEAK